jgi:hypothetical protein
MMRCFRISVLLFLIAVLPACRGVGHLRSPEKKAPRATVVRLPPERIGVITLVNEQDRFVLVDVGEKGVPPSGTALKSFREKVETSILTVGDVRRRPFIVGDIVTGAPQKGDEVFK